MGPLTQESRMNHISLVSGRRSAIRSFLALCGTWLLMLLVLALVLLMVPQLAGCGSSDTRQVNAPPVQQESALDAGAAAPAASKLGAPSVAEFKTNLLACK